MPNKELDRKKLKKRFLKLLDDLSLKSQNKSFRQKIWAERKCFPDSEMNIDPPTIDNAVQKLLRFVCWTCTGELLDGVYGSDFVIYNKYMKEMIAYSRFAKDANNSNGNGVLLLAKEALVGEEGLQGAINELVRGEINRVELVYCISIINKDLPEDSIEQAELKYEYYSIAIEVFGQNTIAGNDIAFVGDFSNSIIKLAKIYDSLKNTLAADFDKWQGFYYAKD